MKLHYPVAINIISKVNGKKEDNLKPNHIKIAKPLQVRQIILQKELRTFSFDKKID